MRNRAVRVGVVDDHEAVRIGVAAAASRGASSAEPALQVVGVASTVDALLTPPHPGFDVVALDLSLNDGSRPRDNVRRLMDAGCKVLVFSIGDNVAGMREALAEGAAGVAKKSDPLGVTLEMLRDVALGLPVAGQEVARAIEGDSEFVAANLSLRERETLELYAAGFGQYQVARRMNIAPSSVKKNIDRVREKYAALGRPAETKIDLYRRAIEDGILPPIGPLGEQ